MKGGIRLAVGVGITVIAAVIALAFLIGWRTDRTEPRSTDRLSDSGVYFDVDSVTIPVWYRASGVIESDNKAVISSQVSGVVSTFEAELGDVVHQGVRVVAIRAEELQARRSQIASQLKGAEAQRKLAQSHYERVKDLFENEASTIEELEQAEQRLSDTSAHVAATQEVLREADIQLGYTSVTAPFEGVVGERHVDPGDFVWPGKPLFLLYDPEATELEATIPERYVDKVAIGLEVTVEVEAVNRVLQAQISEIRPHVDPKSRAFVIKCDFIDQADLIYPGMFGTLLLQTGEREAILVPKAALKSSGQLQFVSIYTHGHLQKQYVTLGREYDEGMVEVLSGLSAGDRIMIEEDK